MSSFEQPMNVDSRTGGAVRKITYTLNSIDFKLISRITPHDVTKLSSQQEYKRQLADSLKLFEQSLAPKCYNESR
jgi:hypothetical protein